MNAPFHALAEGLPRRRFTVADVTRMVEVGLIGEDERLEVLDGEIVEMSPKGYRHEGVKGAINRLWGRHCPEGYDFLPETGLYLSPKTYLEPDFIAFRARATLEGLAGPDVLLAIEVADSSLAYDLTQKPGIYASFGVNELWVIDVAGRVVYLHRDPTPDGYSNVGRADATEPLLPRHAPAVLGFSLDALQPG
ncbi:Uma2 family endonuclease [uncultured Enterovirga sp.]|uniref:Uma2 family endonuclease n=1 Tax=uncultured Enterovirga sp. TaxID=2026352 RepID=UPI0035CBFE2D